MIKNNLLKSFEFRLDEEIKNVKTVTGGCINNTYLLLTESKKYFLKLNSSNLSNLFKTEKLGLELLSSTKTIRIPKVILQEEDPEQYLLIEFIDSNPESINYWADFGKRLAQLHKNTSLSFGLDYDNYIGSLHQSNKQHNNWIDFFISERIKPQLKLATKNSFELNNYFEPLYKELKNILPNEKPALLHGDLWSGNQMPDEKGRPCIYDPAVYYGNREVDLAMTTLFGKFPNEFYISYNNEYPLIQGWKDRLDIHNLYPLLVHLNLFGSSYLGQIKQILKRYQ